MFGALVQADPCLSCCLKQKATVLDARISGASYAGVIFNPLRDKPAAIVCSGFNTSGRRLCLSELSEGPHGFEP